MKPEDLAREQQEMESNDGRVLGDEQLEGVAGGGLRYDDPRNKDHSNKKDDPKDC